MGKVPLSDKEEFPEMENVDLSDLQLIYHVRGTLVAVTLSTTEMVNKNNLQGNLVVENLDNLMVLTFLHLESCQSSGRLAEVFDVLLTSFQRTVLNAYKSKFTQFVMFYACALDPEGCGVKFPMVLAEMFGCDVNPPITRMSAVAYLASYLSRAKFLSAALVAGIIQRLVDWCLDYCKLHDFDMNPRAHQVFYSGCQVCLPTVVEEFLRQAKAAQLFMTSESFIFNDLLESSLSEAFGGMDRLDMFFPFDPCLLKKSERHFLLLYCSLILLLLSTPTVCVLTVSSYIEPHFVHWSRVRTTYDTDDNAEVSDGGSEESDDDFDRNAKNMIDDDMVSVEAGLDFDPDLNKMCITPKSLKYGCEAQLERGM